MENAMRALEMSFGIVIFCVGIYMMLFMGNQLNHEYESFSVTMYENRMIRRD